MEAKKIDVIIPAYKPDEQFKTLINRLMKQTVSPNRIIILQTMVEGEPMLKSEDARVEVYPIQKKDFDHGATRDYGARMSEAEYILFMTQDAMPKDKHLLENLLQGFEQENVGIVYGRQLARKDADVLEQMARLHNYPAESQLKTVEDIERLGIKTYFCSDVCAMYNREQYLALGGFVHPTIFNEDMIMASKFIEAGKVVYYAAEAQVIHSHSYTCMQQFHRNFDLGVSQKQYSDIFDKISSEKEGAGFAKNTIVTLCKKGRMIKAFYFALQCGFRLFGFKFGKNYDKLPHWFVMKCTMTPGYILFQKK